MAVNYPGPYEVRISYTTQVTSGVYEHVMRFSCDLTTSPSPGVDPATLTANQRGGGTVNLVTWVDGLVALVADILNTSSDINTAELWEYVPGTFNASWVATWSVATPGTNATVAQEDAQLILTFRTLAGGYGKLDIRHTIYGLGVTLTYITGTALIDDIMDYMSEPDTIVLGRDGGFFVQGLHALRGHNEKMSRDRLRP